MIYAIVVVEKSIKDVIIQINMVDDEANLNRGEKVSESDPQWVGELRDKYQAFRILTKQGRDRLLWSPHDLRKNSLETEYDLRIQEETFNLVDQTRDKLPALIPLTSIENDLTPHLGVRLSLTRGKYFSTATHEQYVLITVGQDLDGRFDPESSEFLGFNQIREMIERRARGTHRVTIIPPQTEYLRKGQVQEEVALVLSGVRKYLPEIDREAYVDPVEQKIKDLEEEKSSKIREGIAECSMSLQKLISEILQLVPENYRANIPPYFDLGPTYKDWDKRDGHRRIFFIPSLGELVISPNKANITPSDRANKLLRELVMSRVKPNQNPGFVDKLLMSLKRTPGDLPKDWHLEAASDTDWLLYSGRILSELAKCLPKQYGDGL